MALPKPNAALFPTRRYPAPEATPAQGWPDRIYLCDAGVGITFALIDGGLLLLETHLGDRLVIVEDVTLEWKRLAGARLTIPSRYADADIRARYQRDKRVQLAAKGLLAAGWADRGRGLDVEEIDEIENLRRDIAALPKAEPTPDRDDDKHRGECATVRLAEITGRASSLILTNDGKALKLASNRGISSRTAPELLRELVLAGRISGEAAAEQWEKVWDVSRVPASRMPGEGFFSARPAA